MKKLTTRATIETLAFEENVESTVQSAIAFIKHTNNIRLSREKINNIKTVLSEAINNIVTFAYQNNQGNIYICVSIYDNKVLKLKVRDWGCGIEDIEKAQAPLFTTEEGRSGMGFTIMQSFSDKLKVKSTVGKGTTVTMEFKM